MDAREFHREHVHAFTDKLLELAGRVPFSVTSWGRTVARNRAVGGVPLSYHLEWCAVDGVPDDKADNPKLAAAARELGLTAIDEGDHVHLQLSFRNFTA